MAPTAWGTRVARCIRLKHPKDAFLDFSFFFCFFFFPRSSLLPLRDSRRARARVRETSQAEEHHVFRAQRNEAKKGNYVFTLRKRDQPLDKSVFIRKKARASPLLDLSNYQPRAITASPLSFFVLSSEKEILLVKWKEIKWLLDREKLGYRYFFDGIKMAATMRTNLSILKSLQRPSLNLQGNPSLSLADYTPE